ncbi:uncharacterized protein [Ambystoma mexicanum]|uniref:uncharacterized protein n=1 Tax=Ambystoma mexicanum TaxID=8296 RepID=UPI0037E8B8F2
MVISGKSEDKEKTKGSGGLGGQTSRQCFICRQCNILTVCSQKTEHCFAAMEISLGILLLVSLGILLLVSAVFGIIQGDHQKLEDRLNQRLEGLCDDLEDFNSILARKRHSLEKHAMSLRFIADEMDTIHKDIAKDMVMLSAVAFAGDALNMGGVVLDYMGKGSSVISLVGKGISTVGGYLRESASSSEEQHFHNKKVADKTFAECEQDLHEISDLHHEIKAKLQDLEYEEGLLGTKIHQKFMEIKRRLNYFKPSAIEKKYDDLKSNLITFVASLAIYTETVTSLKDTFSKETSKSAIIEPFVGQTNPTPSGSSEVVSGEIVKKGPLANAGHIVKAGVAAASLYRDGKELYKGILHLNQGAKSKLAENLREMAAYLDNVIERLDRMLPKGSRGFNI